MLNVSPGLNVGIEHNETNRATASLRPQPQTPASPIVDLVLTGTAYGHADFEQAVQFQIGGNGVVTVRIHETDFIKALVITDAGQVYPAP